ncbi:MAG: radical SAM protein, partial [Vicinamibacterales bacterium]
MPRDRRLVHQLGRSAHLGLALLHATAGRPSAPLKLNLCLTYWCQYKCKTCNIWRRKPSDELTTEELIALVRENPNINWLDLTGGEIFLRSDIDEIFEAIVAGWRRLAILHFPTNGFQTDRIVASVERLARRGSARTIVTVSLDGDEALNDEIRGIRGGFRRQIETFKALRRIPGIVTALGMTLSTYNLGRFDQTFDACARECPGLSIDDVHLNVAQKSGHYYGNAE